MEAARQNTSTSVIKFAQNQILQKLAASILPVLRKQRPIHVDLRDGKMRQVANNLTLLCCLHENQDGLANGNDVIQSSSQWKSCFHTCLSSEDRDNENKHGYAISSDIV